MAPRRRRKRPAASAPGLTWRGGRAYWQREHPRLPGERVYKSLGTADPDVATSLANLLNRIGWERGDWDFIARWVSGDLHLTDLVRADREGEWKRLRMAHRDGVLMRTMADAYLERVGATRSKRTRVMYASVVERAVERFGDRRMHELTTAEAESYLHEKRLDGEAWSPRTQGTQKTVLAALWQFAMEREAEDAERAGALPSIILNPWKRAEAATIKRTRFTYLRPDEARALLAHSAVRHTPTEALLATAIYAGLRLGELAHLRTDRDVLLGPDWRSSLIVVQGREGEYAWKPKTDRGERKLRPIPALYERLVYHRAKYAGERYFFKPETDDCPPHSSTVTRWVQLAFAAAGIKYGRKGEALSLHSLRHGYATWQVAAGIPIPTVAKRLGDTAVVVLRTYAHAMPEQDELADSVLQASAVEVVVGGSGVEIDAKSQREGGKS